ncbi:Phage tail completion protein R [Escherichia coli]|nr:Phage tail completion protein R [Escherichia coli]
MLKTDSLREAMTRSCRWCQANPEKFTIFVESGNIETTGRNALVCLPLSDGDVCHGLRRGAGRPHAAAAGVVIRKSATVVAQSGA